MITIKILTKPRTYAKCHQETQIKDPSDLIKESSATNPMSIIQETKDVKNKESNGNGKNI